ncbi:MAG TPA: hypothetical protein ENG87_04130 [Candidatus Pacearchaeota archaeon]|nr:hypothetical protein BMS3Abin17_00708 [archaeon BMS3Abin17]HDK42542.1 hypothetical protein [Candidatus Pacearchaeota archaeon]HDZ61096.1 hypothetical protein [Candidatus Pacearchaeota archaeon]
MLNKRAQEEMVGFALIIIVVAVILLIFLSFSLRDSKKETVESYEIESFINAFLQHTTDCGSYRTSHLSIRELIFDCNSNEKCLDERDTCEVLNSTLVEILDENWKIGEDRPIKGYELKILRNSAVSMVIQKGDITKNYKGDFVDLGKASTEVYFTAYY